MAVDQEDRIVISIISLCYSYIMLHVTLGCAQNNNNNRKPKLLSLTQSENYSFVASFDKMYFLGVSNPPQ